MGAWLALPGDGQAQGLVSFRLEVPAGAVAESVRIDAVRFFAGGVQIGELMRPLRTVGGGNVVQVGLFLPGLPDAVTVEYEADAAGVAGLPTRYDLAGPDLLSGVPLRLEVPSPGGSALPGAAGPGEVRFVLTLPGGSGPADDELPPRCRITADSRGALEIAVQDAESGLGSVRVVSSRNVDVSIPSFAPGTLDTVVAIASVLDPGRTAIVALLLEDEAGNTALCQRVRRGLRAASIRTRVRRGSGY